MKEAATALDGVAASASGPGNPLSDPTATGLSPRVAATLAYAGWWVSGVLFLLAEPANRFVRFHARQALLGLGALWLAGLVLWGVSFAAAFVSTAVFRISGALAQVTWAAGVVLWIVCLVQAWRGRWWAIPGISRRVQSGGQR